MLTLEGTTMHPRCRHTVETYLHDFSFLAQVKIQFQTLKKEKKVKQITSQNSILNFFEKISNFGVSMV